MTNLVVAKDEKDGVEVEVMVPEEAIKFEAEVTLQNKQSLT